MSNEGEELLLWVAVVLGVVEGLTEFIPVSSTGHLILFADYLGFHGLRAATFEIFIQLGAILGVVVLYWKRFLALVPGKNSSSSAGLRGWSGIGKIAVACMPAFITGAMFHSYIKLYLFSSLTVAWALIFGGIVLTFIERIIPHGRVKKLDDITYLQAFWVGLFQCLALWPGVSRSGSTIVGGLFAGLNRVTAAEFSFIIAVPVMSAAVGYDLLKSAEYLTLLDVIPFLVGFLVSMVTGMIAIRLFIRILGAYSLAAFGWYRIALGVLVLCLL